MTNYIITPVFLSSSSSLLSWFLFVLCLLTFSSHVLATHSEPDSTNPRICSATLSAAQQACSARVNNILQSGAASGNSDVTVSLHSNSCASETLPAYERRQRVCSTYTLDCAYGDPSAACSIHPEFIAYVLGVEAQIAAEPDFYCSTLPPPDVPNLGRQCSISVPNISFTSVVCSNKYIEWTYPYPPLYCALPAHDDTAAGESADRAENAADDAERSASDAERSANRAAVSSSSAASSRNQAADSARDADASADEARAAEAGAEAAEARADQSADDAGDSAADAEGSATLAEQSADDAGDSATDAAGSATSAQQSASTAQTATSLLPGIFESIFAADVIPLLGDIEYNTRATSIWLGSILGGATLSVEDSALADIINAVIRAGKVDVNDPGTHAALAAIETILNAMRVHAQACQYSNISYDQWQSPGSVNPSDVIDPAPVTGSGSICRTLPADMKRARVRLEQLAWIALQDSGKLDDIQDILGDIRGACSVSLASFDAASDSIINWNRLQGDTSSNLCNYWKADIQRMLARATEHSSILRRILSENEDFGSILGSILNVNEDLQGVLGAGGKLDVFIADFFAPCTPSLPESPGGGCNDYGSMTDIANEQHEDSEAEQAILSDIEAGQDEVGQAVRNSGITGAQMSQEIERVGVGTPAADALLAQTGCKYTDSSTIICPADLNNVAARSGVNAADLMAWGVRNDFDFCGDENYIVVEYGCTAARNGTTPLDCAVSCPASADGDLLTAINEQLAINDQTDLLGEIQDSIEEQTGVLEDIRDQQQEVEDYLGTADSGPTDEELATIPGLVSESDIGGRLTDAISDATGFDGVVFRTCPVISTIEVGNFVVDFSDANVIFCNILLLLRGFGYMSMAIVSGFIFFRTV